MPSSDLSISGLQIGQPDDWSVKRTGDPLAAVVELSGELPAGAELRLTISDLSDRAVLDVCAPIAADPVDHPSGRCHAAMTIPAGSLPAGRFSMSAALTGGDQHRHRHMLEILGAPDGDPPALDAADRAALGPWVVSPGPLPRAPHLRRVEQVRVQLEDCREPLVIPGDVPVRVQARLWLDELEVDPLLRIQIFSQSGELVVGTNNQRWDLSLGTAGTQTVCADFERLNLAPGHYFTTVGLWPDEVSGEPIEARHGYYDLLIGPGALR